MNSVVCQEIERSNPLFQTPVRAVRTDSLDPNKPGLSRLVDAEGNALDLHNPFVLLRMATALNASLGSLPGPIQHSVQVVTNAYTKRPEAKTEYWLEMVDTEEPVDFGPPGNRMAVLEQIAAALNAG